MLVAAYHKDAFDMLPHHGGARGAQLYPSIGRADGTVRKSSLDTCPHIPYLPVKVTNRPTSLAVTDQEAFEP